VTEQVKCKGASHRQRANRCATKPHSRDNNPSFSAFGRSTWAGFYVKTDELLRAASTEFACWIWPVTLPTSVVAITDCTEVCSNNCFRSRNERHSVWWNTWCSAWDFVVSIVPTWSRCRSHAPFLFFRGSCGCLKVLEFFFRFSRPGKSLKTDRHGPWKCLNLCLKVLESAWIWFSKMPWPNQLILKKVFQMASFWSQICIKSGPRWGSLRRLYLFVKVPVWFNLVLFIYPSYGPWKYLKSPWIRFWQMGKNLDFYTASVFTMVEVHVADEFVKMRLFTLSLAHDELWRCCWWKRTTSRSCRTQKRAIIMVSPIYFDNVDMLTHH